MTGLVDAHFHIWRQADLPWLLGPMQPRIFGPYGPIRRDYPVEEYLATCSNIVSKLSGLGTFPRHNNPAHIVFVAGETLSLFGAERCLFGSNFPIEKLWTTYAAFVEAHRAGIPAVDHDHVFNKTARRRVYRLSQ